MQSLRRKSIVSFSWLEYKQNRNPETKYLTYDSTKH